MIVVYRHLAAKTIIIGVYSDMNRAKRAAEQQGYKHNKVKYEGFELNDGISELPNVGCRNIGGNK